MAGDTRHDDRGHEFDPSLRRVLVLTVAIAVPTLLVTTVLFAFTSGPGAAIAPLVGLVALLFSHARWLLRRR